MKRVVVTGMASLTAFGNTWEDFKGSLNRGRNATQYMDDWSEIDGLNTKLATPIPDLTLPSHFTRKKIRSMGRGSIMATMAAEQALKYADLTDSPEITSGATGVAFGSCMGSTGPIPAYGRLLQDKVMAGVTATSYIQMMGHTTPVNIAVFLGLKGRVHTTSSACTSGSQGIGYAYEAVRFGKQKIMIAGGAEELCVTQVAVFDTMYAASMKNDTPEMTPRPFDQDRDGLVIGEGAGALILEELEHAQARGANILAEIVGYGTNCDGAHITRPEKDTMRAAMQQALDDAQISPDAIGYVNAHGTATEQGDIAETHATREVFQRRIPISSLKSYLGHTLGACGAIEAWATVNMMDDNAFAPTLNLQNLDPRCADLDYIIEAFRNLDTEYVMSNNFAFGGINTSLIFRKWPK
ncbi:MAG: beta-ketoacyl-ACP synthase [Pseudomonadales bacterium]|nr:beta-ketoacyl-ACP synthase [Pseudomonadales bacterium]